MSIEDEDDYEVRRGVFRQDEIHLLPSRPGLRPGEIRDGEVVYLKSGGPPMSVLRVEGEEVVVSFLGGSGVTEEGFLAVCLTRDSEAG